MEEAPKKGKESSHSAHANGMYEMYCMSYVQFVSRYLRLLNNDSIRIEICRRILGTFCMIECSVLVQ